MVYSEVTQKTVDQLVSIFRTTGDFATALDACLKELVEGLKLDRALLWQIVGTTLTVTNQFSAEGHSTVPADTFLSAMAGSAIVLNFLSEFPNEQDSGVIELNNDSSAQWPPLLPVLQGFRSNLLVQLRARGIFTGIIVLQSEAERQWSNPEILTVEQVTQVLSLLISLQFDSTRLGQNAMDYKTLAKILTLFITEAESWQTIARKAVQAIADDMSFNRYWLYLYESEKLVSQFASRESIELSSNANVFVEVFKSRRPALLEPDSNEQFGSSAALVIPLLGETNEALGVFAIWQHGYKTRLTAQDQERVLWIVREFSAYLGAVRRRNS